MKIVTCLCVCGGGGEWNLYNFVWIDTYFCDHENKKCWEKLFELPWTCLIEYVLIDHDHDLKHYKIWNSHDLKHYKIWNKLLTVVV